MGWIQRSCEAHRQGLISRRESSARGHPWRRDDQTVAFRADRRNGVQGIYAGRAGSIRVVAETGEYFESLGLFPSTPRAVSLGLFDSPVAIRASLADGRHVVLRADPAR